MSISKIGAGIGVPPRQLKDATFTRLPSDGKFYCRIDMAGGDTYYMTSLQALRLSGRGGPGPRRFEKWLKAEKKKDKS